MLNHQIEFSQACAEIYRPISGRVSDPDSAIPEGNPEGIRACEEYEAIVKELLATLQPELEMIETRVIQPADELSSSPWSESSSAHCSNPSTICS